MSAFMSGWNGLAWGYFAIQAPMLVGLARGRADFKKYLTSPVLAVPLTVASGIGMAAATPLLSHLGLAPHGFAQLAVGTVACLAIGYAGGWAAAQRTDTSHRRGALVSEQPQAGDRRASLPDSAGRAQDSSNSSEVLRHRPLTLGGAVIAASDESKHFKFIGTTGTGKSTAIEELLRGALARGDRAVIADPDGGYMRRFFDAKRGDVFLNPFEADSQKWDLFGEIRRDYDVDQLARSLIPDPGGAADKSWSGYARTFFSAVTCQAHASGIKDIGELYRLLVVAEPEELKILVEGTPAQPFLNQHNGRMFDSIRSVTSSAVGAIERVARQKTAGFSIRDWVDRDSPGVLFMPYKAGQIAALRSTVSAWMRLAIFEAMDRDEVPDERERSANPRRLWFVVDELDALGQIDGLKDALARLRKFGGRCVLGFQSIAQVSSTYGQGDAHTIVENCGNTLIFRCSASEGGGTARFASQLIGDREVMRSTATRSRRYTELMGSISHSEHIEVEPAVLPSQIEQLPDLSGYLKHASDSRWHRVRLDAVQRWRDGHEGDSARSVRDGIGSRAQADRAHE